MQQVQKTKVVLKASLPMVPTDIWECENVAVWKEALANTAAEPIPSFGGRPYTYEDHVALLGWKMKRGVWHGMLMKYAKDLTNEEVEGAAENARKETNWKRKIKAMCVLKGTGVALATAFLSAEDPMSYPFMSDGLIARVMGKNYVPKYTVKEYERMLEAVLAKKAALGGELSCADIERACVQKQK